MDDASKTEGTEPVGEYFQLPLLCANLCWSAWAGFWGAYAPRPLVPEDHQQLVVPEPIEGEGEHALFA